MIRDLAPRFPASPRLLYRVIVRYDPDTLSDVRVRSAVRDEERSKDVKEERISRPIDAFDASVDRPGHIDMEFRIGRWGFGRFDRKQGYVELDPSTVTDWEPLVKEKIAHIRGPIMRAVDNHVFKKSQ